MHAIQCDNQKLTEVNSQAKTPRRNYYIVHLPILKLKNLSTIFIIPRCLSRVSITKCGGYVYGIMNKGKCCTKGNKDKKMIRIVIEAVKYLMVDQIKSKTQYLSHN